MARMRQKACLDSPSSVYSNSK